MLPIYWQRNVRWTELRELSNETIRAIQADNLAPHTLVVLEDDLSTRANFRHVFGAPAARGVGADLRNELSLWIEPPPPESAGNVKPAGAARVVSYRLVNGRVESRPAALPSN